MKPHIFKSPLFLITSLAIIFTGLWSSSGTLDVVDAGNRLRAATSFVESGKFNIIKLGDLENPPVFEDRHGQYGFYWGIGQVAYYIPCVAIAKVCTLPLAKNVNLADRLTGVIISYISVISCLLANFWLSFLIARKLTINRLYSYLLAVIATFGSSYWQITKQGQEEMQLSVLLLAASLSYLSWLNSEQTQPESPQAKYIWYIGIAVAISILFRPTAITFCLGFGILIVFEMWRRPKAMRVKFSDVKFSSISELFKQLFPLGFMTTVSLAISAWFNFYKTGNILKTGNEHSLVAATTANWTHGFFEALIGIDKGIWISNLWLIPFIIASLILFRKADSQWKQLFFLSWFLIISSSFICSHLSYWSGDFTYASRYQIHAVSLLAIVTGSAYAHLLANFFNDQNSNYKNTNITMLLTTILMVALQIPSIAFHCSLEIYQAIGTKGYASSPEITVTSQIGGQIPMRYKNFLARISTGKVVQLKDIKEEQRVLVENNSRWNFLPYLSYKYLSLTLAKCVKFFFYLYILTSLALWITATRLAWNKSQTSMAIQL